MKKNGAIIPFITSKNDDFYINFLVVVVDVPRIISGS